ncbi:8038_t:CDS:2 [Paraglomus occultum]|uniref:8038_t:CDS:1 n=1 Tax=Paraglomus occultum TaxID=144539 RepID=A0A9N8YWZ9_9GLOM|nr:8038_t:CDS:2 [Paraglomus occultum]
MSTHTRRTGSWETEEDQKLKRLVKTLGIKNWKLIGTQHGTRDGKQCRERWTNHLDPNLLYSPITHEEDLQILEMYKKLNTKWAEMGKQLKRPANMIKNRFYSKLYRRVEKNQHEKKWCSEMSKLREEHIREKDEIRKIKKDGRHFKRSNDAETRKKKTRVGNKSKEVNPAPEIIFPVQTSALVTLDTTPIHHSKLSTNDNGSTYLYPNSYNAHHGPNTHDTISSYVYHKPSQFVSLISSYIPLTPPYTPLSSDAYVEKSNWMSTGLCNDIITADKVKVEVETRTELGHDVTDSLMRLADVAVEEKEKLANNLPTRSLDVMSIDTLLN